MIRIIIILIFFFLSTCKACAQEPVFSSVFLIPETMNPSFTGILESNTVGLIHRSQWPNLDLKVDSDYAFVNTWNESIKSGIGVSVISQKQNFSNYSFAQLDFKYAYKVQLTDEWIFRPAIQIGWGTNSFNSTHIYLEDQIDILNGVVNPISSESLYKNEESNFFDFSAGMLIYNEDFFLGTSLKHLNKPNISFLSDGIVPLDMFFSVNTGCQFTIADYVDIIQFPYEAKLKLTSNYMKQGNFNRVDLGVTLDFSTFYFGFSGISNLKPSKSQSAFGSIGLFGGLNYEHFQFGYSYDLSVLKGLDTGGAHEFLLMYRFDFYKECFTCPKN
jgi:type IX secretion system PorP/SprF family membrane protein